MIDWTKPIETADTFEPVKVEQTYSSIDASAALSGRPITRFLKTIVEFQGAKRKKPSMRLWYNAHGECTGQAPKWQAAPKVQERIDIQEYADSVGVKIIHQSSPTFRRFTVAYHHRPGRNMKECSIVWCNPRDTWNNRFGAITAIDRFEDGARVYLPFEYPSDLRRMLAGA